MMQFFLTTFLWIDFQRGLVLLDFEGRAEGGAELKSTLWKIFSSQPVFTVEGAGDKMVPVRQTRWSYSGEGELQQLLEPISTL